MLSASRRPTGYRRCPGGHEVDHRRPPVRVRRRGDHARRLVQRVDDARARPAHELAVDGDRLLAADVARRVGDHGAVDGHPPVGDERLGGAPRGDAGVGEVLSEAHGPLTLDCSFMRRDDRASSPRTTPTAASTGGSARISAAMRRAVRAVRRVAGEPDDRLAQPGDRASGPPSSAIPAPSASTRSAFHGWSAKSGTTAIGTPPARPIVTVPEPPWQPSPPRGHQVGLRDPALDADVGRQRPEVRRVAVAPHRHEQAQRQRRERLDGGAVEAREEVHESARPSRRSRRRAGRSSAGPP